MLKFYSHPGILLKDHLKSVSEISQNFIEECNLKFKWYSDIAKIIGFSHDFGKYTTFFQSHLKGEKKYKDVTSHHSLLSALLGAYLVKSYIEDRLKSEYIQIAKFLPLVVYLIIHRHHGDLKSPEGILPRKKDLEDYPKLLRIESAFREEILSLKEKIEDIKKNFDIIETEIIEIISETKAEEIIKIENIKKFLNEDKVIEVFKKLDELRYELIEKEESLNEDGRLKIYFITILLFSTLIDADKKVAGKQTPILIERKEIASDLVDRYKENNFKEYELEINKIRNEIYFSVMVNLQDDEILSNKIFTLTAPTGAGKTLTALSFAFKLREKLKKKRALVQELSIAYLL